MTATLPAPPVSELPEPTAPRWRPLRAGLQDIWQYDHTTRFVFHRGRVLLRGRNGVGKTKVIEVLLPFLLEGRMAPDRLDPFGTRSRRMHYNLLHPANADRASTVGYVWLEFGRRDQDAMRYLTIGAGLKARRSADAVESWFFVVADRRVDIDLHLLDDDHRPLSRPQLTAALGDAGQVFTLSTDYRAAVNRALFGVPPAQYEALVEALLRLRQPHLSERLDPAAVASVLADSLPPLDSERLREVADGFERLESHRRELDDRTRALEAVEGFVRVYRGYARTVAGRRARLLTAADAQVRSAAEQVATAERARRAATDAQVELQDADQRLDGELRTARTRLQTLETSEAVRAVHDLVRAEQDAGEADKRVAAARVAADRDAEDAETAEVAHEDAALRTEQQRTVLDTARREADAAARRADLLAAHDTLAAPLRQIAQGEAPTAAQGLVRTIAEERQRAIARVRAAAAVHDRAVGDEQQAVDRHAEADGEVRQAADDERQAAQDARDADDAHRDAIVSWAATAVGPEDDPVRVSFDDDVLVAIAEVDAADRAAEARRQAAPLREALDQQVTNARVAVDAVDQQRAQVIAERDALAAATHSPPPTPPWRSADRTDRPGAPLYLLAQFTDALAPARQAAVEAALEASGLLDAWVTPDGRILDAGTIDLAVVGQATAQAPTLADVTAPTPHGEVPADVITRVLATVAVGAGDNDRPPAGAGTAWVATDGRWAVGPLHGQAQADDVRYIGETARAAHRARRLAALAARIAALDAERADADRRLTTAQRRKADLDRHLDAFPPPAAVLRARSAADQAARALATARQQFTEAAIQLTTAQNATTAAREALDRTAGEVGLTGHVDRLDQLAEDTTRWRHDVSDAISAAALLAERAAAQRREAAAVAAAHTRAKRSAEAAATAATDAAARHEQVRTLRGMLDADPDEILAQVSAARARVDELDDAKQRSSDQLRGAERAVGETTAALKAAQENHTRVDGERVAAATAFRALGTIGVLRHVLGRPVEDADTWAVRTALEHAREVLGAVTTLPREAEALDKAAERIKNKLGREQQQLQRELVANIRMFPRETGGVVVHDVQYQGRTYDLDGLVTELREDVAERRQRLERDERELLQRFLEGELHEHLRARIRDARALVNRMNDQLAACPTTAGQRVRLDWRVDDDAPPGTSEAIDLLLRGAHLLSDDHREALGAYLQQRLREAREGDVATSLSDRLAGAFDYRRWFGFTIQVRDGGGGTWRRLTRQRHGTGSGGEKAVMLHLPLFAAMAAHYTGAPTGPRMIVLDEVFAGIDRGTRGQLMGLLVELDLDAVLTSHDEWGCYEELDGVSTYHLLRDPDVPGVLAEWFVWDGATQWEMTG